MKRFANATPPPVVVPVVVVAVNVHVPLAIVPPVHREESYKVPPMPPSLKYSRD